MMDGSARNSNRDHRGRSHRTTLLSWDEIDTVSDLTYAEYRANLNAMTPEERQRLCDKAEWEHMSLWAVLNEWPSLCHSVPAEETP